MPQLRKWLTVAAATCVIAASSVSASAASLQVIQFDGNDCPEVFGSTGFESCSIDGSPIVIKFDVEGNITIEVNSAFPSVDGSEFTFVPDLDDDLDAGTFAYTPGLDDPAIRFWVAKGGNEFNLFYWGDPNDLSSAEPITSGQFYDWYTSGGDISHLAFYDTDGTEEPPTEEPQEPAPEPASLALFGLALVGAAYRGRRR